MCHDKNINSMKAGVKMEKSPSINTTAHRQCTWPKPWPAVRY
ncbi:hypothetical protein EaACW_0147 [Erwinia amylovora ACW56400]|nr:hypothetical protein EaACW_0147 [Erwinia amylovora ACW56400]